MGLIVSIHSFTRTCQVQLDECQWRKFSILKIRMQNQQGRQQWGRMVFKLGKGNQNPSNLIKLKEIKKYESGYFGYRTILQFRISSSALALHHHQQQQAAQQVTANKALLHQSNSNNGLNNNNSHTSNNNLNNNHLSHHHIQSPHSTNSHHHHQHHIHNSSNNGWNV